MSGILTPSTGSTPYQLMGNIDQTYGGVSIYMDGGASFHVKDHTENWHLISTDTETVGCNPREITPVNTARIHSFSIGYFPTNIELGMKGQPLAKRVFFFGPPRGLAREMLEDPFIGKVEHQCHYDTHAYANEGLDVIPSLDTLRLSRLLNPHLKEHGLKLLMLKMLGYELGDFKELFSRPKISTATGKPLKTRELIPLNEIKPFTPLFNVLIDYASLDSKATLELGVLLAAMVDVRTTYKLPEYMAYYYGIEPPWLKLLRRIIGSA